MISDAATSLSEIDSLDGWPPTVPLRPGPGYRVRAGYWSPSWRNVIAELRIYGFYGLGLVFAVLWLKFGVFGTILAWTAGETFIVAIAGAAGAFMVALVVNQWLAGWRGGYGLAPRGSRTLEVEFTPGAFRIKVAGQWQCFEATAPHQFLIATHQKARDEAREEARAKLIGVAQIPEHYRRAFQLWLDYGEQRIELASIADEVIARAIVRRLQSLDALVRAPVAVGARAGAGDHTNPGAAPTGARPPID